MKTTVSSKGQIVLPAEIRQQDDVRPGQKFEIERIDRGEYRLRRKARRRNEGLVALLLACPVKGWFEPMDRSETTDDVELPRLG
jgi:AbrB family looped-hinge helix DNA binding protein